MSFIVLGVGNGRRQMLIKEKLDYSTEQCCAVQSRMFPTGHLGSRLGGQIEPTVDKTYSGLCY